MPRELRRLAERAEARKNDGRDGGFGGSRGGGYRRGDRDGGGRDRSYRTEKNEDYCGNRDRGYRGDRDSGGRSKGDCFGSSRYDNRGGSREGGSWVDTKDRTAGSLSTNEIATDWPNVNAASAPEIEWEEDTQATTDGNIHSRGKYDFTKARNSNSRAKREERSEIGGKFRTRAFNGRNNNSTKEHGDNHNSRYSKMVDQFATSTVEDSW